MSIEDIVINQTEHPVLVVTKTAVGAVTGRHFIKNSGAQCTVKGERAEGVAKDDAATGKLFAAIVEGTALVVAGAALAADAEVTTNADGHAVAASEGEYVNGITRRAQATVGQLVEIRVGGNLISSVPATTTTTTTTTTTAG